MGPVSRSSRVAAFAVALLGLDRDHARGPINGDHRAFGKPMGRHPGRQDRGDPVLAGEDRGVGEDVAYGGDELTGRAEQGRPGGNRGLADHDVTWLDACQVLLAPHEPDAARGLAG